MRMNLCRVELQIAGYIEKGRSASEKRTSGAKAQLKMQRLWHG
jgi:hypothetical protein